MSTTLKLGRTDGRKFELPPNAATQKFALVGRTGSGKTYGAGKLVEELLGAGAQVVVLDVIGKWWGLRLAKDGESPGFEIPVFGGLKGDVPLTHTAGALVADLIVDRGISVVLDISQFETDTQKARFASDFGDRFFWRKKASPSPVHIVLEECQEFVPQNPQSGETNMLHFWTRIAKLGRNYGIGLSLISQRPQEVNKKAFNMTEVLVAFQMRGKHERKAVADWLTANGGREAVELLPSLQVGTAFVSSPQWLQFEGVVEIGAKRTFDSSATPTDQAMEFEEARELAPIDFQALTDAMAATIAEAEANDPKKLKQELARLQKELLQAQKQSGPTPAQVEEIRASAAAEAVARALDALRSEVRPHLEALRPLQPAVDGLSHVLLNGWEPPVAPVRIAPAPAAARAAPPWRIPGQPGVELRRARARPIRDATEGAGLGKGERQILTAVAQHERGVTREQLSVLTGYKRSSRDTYLQKLKAYGYVEASGDLIVANEDGVAALGDDFEPLPTGELLQRYWLERLSGGERVVLEVLLQAFPHPVDREYISESTPYKRSSRDTYLQKLISRKLVTNEGRGLVRASEDLF